MALHTPQHILKGTSKLDNCLYDQCVLKIYELHDSYLVEAINTRIYILKIVHQPLKRWLNGGPRHNKVRKRLPCIWRHLIVYSMCTCHASIGQSSMLRATYTCSLNIAQRLSPMGSMMLLERRYSIEVRDSINVHIYTLGRNFVTPKVGYIVNYQIT